MLCLTVEFVFDNLKLNSQFTQNGKIGFFNSERARAVGKAACNNALLTFYNLEDDRNPISAWAPKLVRFLVSVHFRFQPNFNILLSDPGLLV